MSSRNFHVIMLLFDVKSILILKHLTDKHFDSIEKGLFFGFVNIVGK